MSILYNIDQIITTVKGKRIWYDRLVSLAQIVKQNQDDIGNLSVGAAPGVFAAYDTRFYVTESGFASGAYTAALSPVATGQALPTGYSILFVPATENTGSSTLDVGSTDGAVGIKKYSSGSKADIATADLLVDEVVRLTFDGTDWIAKLVAEPASSTVPVTFVTGTTYDITTADANSFLICNNVSGCVVTLDPNVLSVGHWFTVLQSGANHVELVGGIDGGDSMTIQRPSLFTLRTYGLNSTITVLVKNESSGDQFAIASGHMEIA